MSDEWKPVERVLPPNAHGNQQPGAGSPVDGPPRGWQSVPPPGQAYGAPPLPAAYPYQQSAAASSYGVITPQKKSHVVRNILLIVLALVLLGVACCGALVYKGMTMLRDSRPTQLAVHTAEGSPVIQQRIGVPLKPSPWITGGVNSSLNGGVKTGTADLKINVSGPRGSGTLLARETLSNEGWKVVSLSFSDDSGAIPLVSPTVSAPREDTF